MNEQRSHRPSRDIMPEEICRRIVLDYGNQKEPKMMHVVRQIRRHFPNSGNRVAATLLALSALALAVGIGIMFLK